MHKERLSIQLFGKTRFYMGLVNGILWTILLFVFFAFVREILRVESISGDLIYLSSKENLGYNLFFAALSVTIGFGQTIWFWFHNPFLLKISRRWALNISTFSIFLTLILLMLVWRMASVLIFFLYEVELYEKEYSLYHHFPLVLMLLPLVFFLNMWVPIRLKYRSASWFWISCLVYCVMTVTLGLAPPVDQQIINRAWTIKNAPYEAIVNAEVKRARENGIILSKKAIATLRLKYTHSVYTLAEDLKETFKSSQSIPTDSIVMELILVKLTHLSCFCASPWNDEEGEWPYALPRDIYHQIQLSNDSLKTSYLQELLLEYKSMFEYSDTWEIEGYGLESHLYNRMDLSRWYPSIETELFTFLQLLEEK